MLVAGIVLGVGVGVAGVGDAVGVGDVDEVGLGVAVGVAELATLFALDFFAVGAEAWAA